MTNNIYTEIELINQRILDLAIKHWNSTFTGISSLSIAEQVKLPHDVVRERLLELKNQDQGQLRENEKVFEQTFASDHIVTVEGIATSIFFPSTNVLSKHYFDSGLVHKNLPEYIVRLHKGASQIAFVYFEHSVLQKYLSHPEIYKVKNEIIGGSIRMQEVVAGDQEERSTTNSG